MGEFVEGRSRYLTALALATGLLLTGCTNDTVDNSESSPAAAAAPERPPIDEAAYQRAIAASLAIDQATDKACDTLILGFLNGSPQVTALTKENRESSRGDGFLYNTHLAKQIGDTGLIEIDVLTKRNEAPSLHGFFVCVNEVIAQEFANTADRSLYVANQDSVHPVTSVDVRQAQARYQDEESAVVIDNTNTSEALRLTLQPYEVGFKYPRTYNDGTRIPTGLDIAGLHDVQQATEYVSDLLDQ